MQSEFIINRLTNRCIVAVAVLNTVLQHLISSHLTLHTEAATLLTYTQCQNQNVYSHLLQQGKLTKVRMTWSPPATVMELHMTVVYTLYKCLYLCLHTKRSSSNIVVFYIWLCKYIFVTSFHFSFFLLFTPSVGASRKNSCGIQI